MLNQGRVGGKEVPQVIDEWGKYIKKNSGDHSVFHDSVKRDKKKILPKFLWVVSSLSTRMEEVELMVNFYRVSKT